MFDLPAIQDAIRSFDVDGWLLYDFRGSNVLAQRILDLGEDAIGSRRYLYSIPAHAQPRKLVHRIESAALDHLPGERTVYLKWQELEAGIEQLVKGDRRGEATKVDRILVMRKPGARRYRARAPRRVIQELAIEA